MRSLAIAVPVGIALALATGCGTTVPISSATSNDALGGDGLTPTQTASQGSVPVTPGRQVVTSSRRATAGPGTAVDTPDTGQLDPTTTVEGGVVQGFGVTASTVTIGLPYSPGADAAAASLGASSVTSGDTKAVMQAIIADVNAHGGVLGRKLVPVYHQYDAASTQPVDQKYAEACADYVGDHKAFAVLDTGRTSFYECLTKKALVVSSDDWGYGASDFRQYPFFVDTSTLAMERAMRAWVQTLVQQSYFTPWDMVRGAPGTIAPKVGVLSVDYPAVNRAVEGVLLPGLKAAGHPVDPSNYVKLNNGNSTADAPSTIAAIQNAVLRFQSNGVTHAIVFDNAGGVTLFFAHAADAQKYYPRLGVTTQNTVQGWLDSGDLTAQQARGARGLGWAPNMDLKTTETGPTSRWGTPSRSHCLAVLKAAGITAPSHNAELIALEFCDRIYFVAHVMNRMDPKRVTREEFMRVVESLGESYTSPTLQRTRFSPTQHDGVALGYPLRFEESCTCMRYGTAFSLA